MSLASRTTLVAVCLISFWAGTFIGSGSPANVRATQAPAAIPNPFPMQDRIGANIYLQTSAEYRACCLQVYKCAGLRLESMIRNSNSSLTNPAVVMDLDETVLDNSAFQTFLYKNKLEYTDELWADYEENYAQDVTSIPGALKFISKARAMGVTVIFISNRQEKYHTSTDKALENLGVKIDGKGILLLLRKDGQNSDKTGRRIEATNGHNVLMYFGDNLRDFSDTFACPKLGDMPAVDVCLKAIKERMSLVDLADCHWGVDWFVLPNPVYGEWERIIGQDPFGIMHITSMKPKAK